MRRILTATLAVLALADSAVLHTERAAAAPDPADNVARYLPLCASDEGESPFPCVWAAFAQGNGHGHSFRIYRDGRVKRVSDARAFELVGGCDADGPLYCRGT